MAKSGKKQQQKSTNSCKEEENTNVKKEKKKAKAEVIENSLATSQDSNKVEKNTDVKKKKKKAKAEVDSGLDTSQDSTKGENISDVKKDKKKTKTKSVDSNQDTHHDSNTLKRKRESSKVDNPEQQGTEPAKKKKSKQSSDSTLGVVDTSILQQAEINLGLPGTESLPATTETDIKKVKKKKKKNGDKTAANDSQKQSDKSRDEKCIDYIRQWSSDKVAWKFNKLLQTRLLNVMYDANLINDSDFTLVLQYLEGLKGKAKEKTVEDAQKILNDDKQDNKETSGDKEDRAKQILQILS
ncbi:uncharacterized protein C7orf50 homolog [Physella acuta]|uniref:uncharacterized protein C7orf50 homolog n=1 Tax=Physella acuta TaxID=109671 RepID=UPI0027DBF6E9|nr:uncharacterized protein C7orf50 homolog [Physella acuta]XP_059142673.1 uncharacterized protein C7orf50 homolog [Physella acuta]